MAAAAAKDRASSIAFTFNDRGDAVGRRGRRPVAIAATAPLTKTVQGEPGRMTIATPSVTATACSSRC